MVAALCALAVAIAMAVASFGTLAALLVSGIIVGLAFGPETPASSTLLARLARPEQRPLIFSVRQTGNQIGAMAGSLMLPAIALAAPRAGYAVIVALWRSPPPPSFSRCAHATTASPADRRSGSTGALPSASCAASRRLPGLRWRRCPIPPCSSRSTPISSPSPSSGWAFRYVTAGLLLAVAQAGGLVGRLGWGWVATHVSTARGVIVGIGLAMAALAILVGCMGPGWPLPLVAAVALLFGLTASGWNGVFLAEVARLAPEGRVAEATGAVLTASYAGLLIGPLLVAAVAGFASLSASYAVLGVVALLVTIPLLRR